MKLLSEEFEEFFGGAVDDFFLGSIDDGLAAVAEEFGGILKGGADDVEDFLEDLVADLGEGGAVIRADVLEGKGGEGDFNTHAHESGVNGTAFDLEVFNDDFFGGFVGGGIAGGAFYFFFTGTGEVLDEGFDIVLEVLEVGALEGLFVADLGAVDVNFFNDDGIAGEAGGLDIDFDFAEFKDVLAFVAFGVADLESGDGAAAGGKGEVDRFNADGCLGDFWADGIDGGGDALVEDAGTEEEEANEAKCEEAEKEKEYFFKHNFRNVKINDCRGLAS